jgi:hypothetical protein
MQRSGCRDLDADQSPRRDDFLALHQVAWIAVAGDYPDEYRAQLHTGLHASAILMTMPLRLLDIEFPLRTRAGDGAREPEGRVAEGAANKTAAETIPVALVPSAPVQFIAERLLAAPGPFGLEVETKSDQRVVGSWNLEVNLRSASGAFVSQAKGHLYVCGSIRGDARATGSFLVLRQWWVQVSDPLELERLYEALSVAVLERLDSLLGNVRNDTAELPTCVLFLVDDRILDRKCLSLDRLQIRLLEDLEGEHAIAGVDLRVAHGRGKEMQPHIGFSLTVPAPLAGDTGDDRRSRGSQREEVFVRETLSPANLRWRRRASDREF